MGADLIIETERTIIRQWREADRAAWRAMNADAQVMRFFPKTLSDAESDEAMERYARGIAENGFSFYAVERKADGAFMGTCGLQRLPYDTPIGRPIEVGWRIDAPFWRQGYALETARACLVDAVTRCGITEDIIAQTAFANEPSWRLMEKLGMVRRADLDFDHPKVDDASPLKRSKVYVISARACRALAAH